MVRISRVYTRKGDSGETRLIGGHAAFKDDPRVRCYGTVDELNSILGIVRAFNAQKPPGRDRDGFDRLLQLVQQRLFDLGAELATPPGQEQPGQVKITVEDVAWLETVIDRLNARLEPLQSFILPGGSLLNAFLHQARTVCRRAEREVVTLARKEKVEPPASAFLNRLSDALFVFGRWTAHSLGEEEVLWAPRLSPETLDWPPEP